MRELVTIQVGSFANYIGSHFWNFQDELLGLADELGDPVFNIPSLNMDALYRTGETHQGVLTYTPRLISIGSQGSLGSLSCSGSLYAAAASADPSDVITWKGRVSRQVAQPCKRNIFLDSLYEDKKESTSENKMLDENGKQAQDKDIVECLEDNVNYWTDFSKVHFHPKSLFELCCSWINFEEFDNYGAGRDILADGLQGDEINDRLRFFIEECDHIQGIQFILDDSGGFSSVAESFLETINDEFCKTPVLLYTAREPAAFTRASSPKKLVMRALHDAVSFSRLSAYCQLIAPMGLPSFTKSNLSEFLCVNDTKPFHSSAVYAASMHSISLPFRMEVVGPTATSDDACGHLDVGELTNMLAGQGMRNMVAILDTTVPAPSLNDKRFSKRSLHPLNFEVTNDAEDLHAVETVVFHGILRAGGNRASISEVRDVVSEWHRNATSRPAASYFSAALCPLPVPLPFPSIFCNHIGQHGELLEDPIEQGHLKGPLEVSSIPMAARLRSSCAILPFIEKRLEHLRRFGIQRGASGAQLLGSWGFSNDETEEMGEVLSKMVTTLQPHPDLSSDSE